MWCEWRIGGLSVVLEQSLCLEAWALPADAVLQLAARWTLRDVGGRERAFAALLSFVDWAALGGDRVALHLDREPLYAASDRALFAALQSLADSHLLLPQHQSAYAAFHHKYHAQLSVSDWMEKCSSSSDTSILVKSHLVLRRWPRKPVHWASRPGARLAALKATLSARRRKLNACNSTFRDVQGHYSCHLCSHVANSLCFLEQHVAVAHCKDVTYKCGVCGFMCQWNEEYLTHMKVHYQGPPYKCESCKFTCDEVNIFLAHRLKHSVDNFCQCDYCGYQCNNHSELTLHKLCHSNVHPYKCETCGKQFNFKASLKRHLLNHGSDRPYLCDSCGFSTKYVSLLIAHKRIHSGAWLLRMKLNPDLLQFSKDPDCWDPE